MKNAEVSVSRRPIPLEKAVRSVLCPSAGGTAVFVGTVRERSEGMRVSRMELETAEDLAMRDLLRIAKGVETKYDVCRISVRHRVGKMNVGDVIVVIAVSSPHRADAFAACKHIIDELKKSTPIWKKEIGVGRQRWVEAER